MRQSRLLHLASFVALAGVAGAQTVNSLDTVTSIAKPYTTYNLTTGALTNLLGVVSGSALKVNFPASVVGQNPNVVFVNTAGYSAIGKGGIAMTITNPGGSDFAFTFSLVDSAGAKFEGATSIAAGATQTFRMDTNSTSVDPMSYGMQMLPSPFTAMRIVKGYGTIDLSKLSQIRIFQRGPAAGGTLIVDDVKILPAFDLNAYLTGIVDGLGQNAKVTYPNKTTTADALVQRRIDERADLNTYPVVGGRTANYGGDANGPTFTATGFFRTQKYNNKWWLVTPDGKPFWSVGFNAAIVSNPTIVQGRDSMFAELPAAPNAFYGTATSVYKGPYPAGSTTFDFLGYNLFRKYGTDYKNQFVNTTLDRAQSWGFNTVGGFSDYAFRKNGRVPYCGTFGIDGNFPRISTGYDYWTTLPDPFDPAFATAITADLQSAQVAAIKDDPYLIGWFVDNELSWVGNGTGVTAQYAIVYSVSRLTWDGSAAKRNFVRQLTAKYPTVADLNLAWGTSFASFLDLNAGFELSTTPTAAQQTDMSNYLLLFMRKYFNTVRDGLRSVDPNHLYMGCRFSRNDSRINYTPEALAAASSFCNVISVNYYSKSMKPADWSFLTDYNAPFIIGEFQFGTTDRGLFNPGIMPVGSTQERADSYKAYLESAARLPSVVGAHWFQYMDQPITGRVFDGQNVNFGLIDVTDSPYPEMVAAAREANANVYTWHKS